METDIVSSSIRESLSEMDSIFNILKKDDKYYVILREDRPDEESRVRRVLGDADMEFTDVFSLLRNRMLKDLSECISIFDNEPLLESLGLREYTEIVYDLTRLGQSQKMLFNYALLGRRGNKGLLQNLGGRRLSKSAVYVPSRNDGEIELFMKHWGVRFNARKTLVFDE